MRSLISLVLGFQILFLVSCFPPFKEEKKKTNSPLLLAAAVIASGNSNCNGLWAIDFNSGAYSCQGVRLVATTANFEIYEQNGLAAESRYSSSSFKYSTVIGALENTIHPKMISAFGTPTDIDKNGKVTVLVLDIGFGIGGYVDPGQFIIDYPSDPYYRSNQREMIYIDGNALLEFRKKNISASLPDPFLSTLAHEYQHLIRFQHELGFSKLIQSLDDVTNKSLTFDDTWINEGTSEVASDISGYGPQYSRMACFRGDPATNCIEGAAGYPLFEWQSSIRNYASAYTFMSYIYNNSGSTETEKNSFIKNTVVGNTSKIRASNLTNMMTLFKSAAKYNSTLLGTDTTGMYRRLYATFLSLAFNPSRYPGTSTLFIGSSTIGTMSSLQTAYPLPTGLNPIYTYPSNFGIVKGSTFLMDPSMFYRVSENSAVAPDNADSVKVWNGTPAVFGSEFIIFNGRVDTIPVTATASFRSDKSNSNFGISKEPFKWNPPVSKSGELFCPHSFITASQSQSTKGVSLKERLQRGNLDK